MDTAIDWSNPSAWVIPPQDCASDMATPLRTTANARKLLIRSAFETFSDCQDLIQQLLLYNSQLHPLSEVGIISLSSLVRKLLRLYANQLSTRRQTLAINGQLKDQIKDELETVFTTAYDQAEDCYSHYYINYYFFAICTWTATYSIMGAKRELDHGIERANRPRSALLSLLHDGLSIGSVFDHSGEQIAIALSFMTRSECDLETIFAPMATVDMYYGSPIVLDNFDLGNLLLTSPDAAQLCALEVSKLHRKEHFDIDGGLECVDLLVHSWGKVSGVVCKDNVWHVSLI